MEWGVIVDIHSNEIWVMNSILYIVRLELATAREELFWIQCDRICLFQLFLNFVDRQGLNEKNLIIHVIRFSSANAITNWYWDKMLFRTLFHNTLHMFSTSFLLGTFTWTWTQIIHFVSLNSFNFPIGLMPVILSFFCRFRSMFF